MFNTNFQNVVPNQNTTINPNQDQYFGQGDRIPYIQAMNPPLPGGGDNFYPLQASLATPSLDPNQQTGYPGRNFAKGGVARAEKNNLSSLAEIIRQQGGVEDTILAHINPIEAQLLGKLSPAARINQATGLPQFGFFKNPLKWLKNIAGGGIGAILGNIIAPGLGGVVGGALGNTAGAAVRGKKKNLLGSALKGAALGAALPTIASGLGAGANALGASSIGSSLQNYGNQNAIFPAIGRLMGNSGAALASQGASNAAPNSSLRQASAASRALPPQNPLLDQLITELEERGYIKQPEASGNFLERFLSQPQNLLTGGVLASAFMNRPREKTPERLAAEQKRYQNALLLNSNELKNREAALLAEAQMKRRIERDQFLPEERLGNIPPLYMKTHSPAEYQRSGRWTSYYDNPEFSGAPINMKHGGLVPSQTMIEEDIIMPFSLGRYIQGDTKGQADAIDARVSDGEYIIPADVVAAQGDGNNSAGAKELDQYVYNVRKHKAGGKTVAKGGKGRLPPKAKSITTYMKKKIA